MSKLPLIGLVAALITLTGCSASNCDVEIYVDPELKTAYGQLPSMEVDIAGVNAVQAQRLQKLNLDQYFMPGSPQRRALSPITFYFSAENPEPMILDSGDDLWDKWEERGAKFIAVICNLPEILHLQSDQQNQNDTGALAGEMAEMANENAAVFNNGRVLLINMHDGFFKDSSKHLVQISVDGLLTLDSRPDNYVTKPKETQVKIRNVQDLKKLEQEEMAKQLELSEQAGNLEQLNQFGGEVVEPGSSLEQQSVLPQAGQGMVDSISSGHSLLQSMPQP